MVVMLEFFPTDRETQLRLLRFLAVGGGSALVQLAVLRGLKARMNETLAFQLYRDARIARTSKVQRVSHENAWMNVPMDPSWVFAYDAMTVPLTNPAPHAEGAQQVA